MKTIVLGAIAALALTVQPAHAGRSCGGGGGNSSSSDNDNDRSSTVYDDSSWSAPTTSHSAGGAAETGGCTDASDVVGYRYCTKYGHGWATNPRVPRLFVELGTNVRQFSADPGARTGSVWHGSENFMYRMVAPSGEGGATAGAVATTLRIGVGLPHGMYAGIEGELGGLTSSNTRLEMMASGIYGSPEVETRTALLLGGAGFVGARVSSGRASLAIEGAGGVRDVRYRAKSSYHHCEEIAAVDVVQGVLEARARGELWLNPWITLGAQAGANVAAKGDWMTGLYLGVHTRAFGGR